MYKRNVIKGEFILVSGDTVTNMNLTQALEEHRERKENDKSAVMTMVIKQSDPCQVTRDGIIMAIDPTTKQLLHYDDKTDDLKFDKSYLSVNPCYYLHNDKQDCRIDICSPQVLSLFTNDNFDCQHLRGGDFVKGLLADDAMGFKVFTHEIHPSYYAEFPSNNPTKLESETESEVMESKDELFEKKVETVFSRAVGENADVAHTVSELQRVRLYYSMALGKCAGTLLYLMMKLALDNSNNSGNDLVKETHHVISKWRGLLKPFSRGVVEKIQVILKLEEICLESAEPLFVPVLYVLYVKSIIQEEAILKWAQDKEHADESDKVFVNQSQKFIQWLKEEKYPETDLKSFKEGGGVQVKKSRPRSACFIGELERESNGLARMLKKKASVKDNLGSRLLCRTDESWTW